LCDDQSIENKYQAIHWYLKAAELGHVGAQYNLGLLYESGTGVKQDDHEAISWFLKAAKQNDANALFKLGVISAKGLGVEQDDDKAIGYFMDAANEGNLTAIFNMRVMYEIACGTRGAYGNRLSIISADRYCTWPDHRLP
jgi:hypothetical protein